MVVAIAAHRIAYMPVPKAACTSVKAALATIDPEVAARLDTLEGRPHRVHGFYPTMRFRRSRWQAYDGWWRFTVVRDPLERLLAVWTDRVHGREELQNSPRLRRQSHLPLDPDPDFFFQNLKAYMDHASVIKHHALPTAIFIGYSLLNYDEVFRLTEMPDLARTLSERTGTPVTMPRFNRSRAQLSLHDLQPQTRAFLAEYLAGDYDLLSDYFPNPFA